MVQQRSLVVYFLTLFYVAVFGCGPRQSEVVESSRKPPAQGETPTLDTTLADTVRRDAVRGAFWEAVYMAGGKIGYTESSWQPATADSTAVQWQMRLNQTIKRFGELTQQELTGGSIETAEGQVLSCWWTMKAGSQTVTSWRAERQGEQLQVSTESPGRSAKSLLPCPADTKGFFAVEQSLRKNPLQPGETREIQALMPIFNEIAVLRLTAGEFAQTELPGGPQRLLRVVHSARMSGTQIDTILWVNHEGETLKTEIADIDQVSYRVDRGTALRESADVKPDLGWASIAKLQPTTKGHRADLHHARQAHYRLSKPGLNGLFSGPSQTARTVGNGVELTVRAIRPDSEMATESAVPTPADTAASSFIQSEDPTIVRLAAVSADDADPWLLARALERKVHEHVTQVDFSQGLATASDVAQSRRGDCTEHAVLLAAICRARKLPARVAVGLVYSAEAGGFAPHMWNEVWIADRWIPMDATLALGGIGAGHIKVDDSAMEDSGGFTVFLPILQMMSGLEIELLDVKN